MVGEVKAFVVQETCEMTGGIVYAKTNAQARRLGSCQYADGDFFSVTCRRFPQADGLERDPRAQQWALFDAGWWHEVDGGSIGAEDQPFVSKAGVVYRTPFEWLRDREAQIWRNCIKRRREAELWQKWWFADRITVRVEPAGTINADIDLPHLRYGVRFLEREDRHTVSACDLLNYYRAYRVYRNDDDYYYKADGDG